jgi:hypothetical protein
MANVSGNLAINAGLTQLVTSGLVTPQSIPAAVGQNIGYTNGTGASQCDLIHAKKYALVASTPQSPDFTSITDLSGATVNFARIRELICWIDDTNLGHTVALGDAGSNPLAAFWGTTGIQTIYPGGAVYRFSDPTSVGSSVGAVVTSSSKVLKIDPGSNGVNFNLIVLGCSAVS